MNIEQKLKSMNYHDHFITEKPVDEEGDWEMKTSHPRVTFDTSVESFNVDLGEGCWCEVYGKDRFKKAILLAEFIAEWEKLEDEQ